MEKDLSYDSALARLKEIVTLLESDEAVSIEEYKKLATEAKQLLLFCRDCLKSIEEEVNSVLS